MSEWPEIICPQCDRKADPPKEIEVDCGEVSGECVCRNCDNHFPSPKIKYWSWLGLTTAPPD